MKAQGFGKVKNRPVVSRPNIPNPEPTKRLLHSKPKVTKETLHQVCCLAVSYRQN